MKRDQNDYFCSLKKLLMTASDIEIMAPVGSYESLQAAIQGGANSVYFGIGSLNMRSKSSQNFTLDDLARITALSQQANIRTYLTLNAVIYDHELEQMRQLVDAAKDNSVSAIIASDQSVIQYARQIGMEIHMSTQTNITNLEAVKYYAQFADVMVTARELQIEQVKAITQAIEKQQIKGPSGNLVQIEVFAHGALCMAVSGKCYLSLDNLNSSANRGACLQQCRRKYIVKDKESDLELEIDNEYIMSPKDLKTIHFLDKILDAGVSVLKIEGRARSAEYVKTTVQCYHEAVEAYFDNSFTEDKIEDWNTRLGQVFNRGFWDGYYLGQRLGEWSKNYGSLATKRKLYVGKCTNYFANIGVAEFKLETGNLKVGDEIIITGVTTGVVQTVVTEIRTDLEPVEEGKKGEKVSVKIDTKLRRMDKLYKMIDAKEVKERR